MLQTKEQILEKLLNIWKNQAIDLSMMSKIEFGNDVINEIHSLDKELETLKQNQYIPFISEVEEFNIAMGKPEANNYIPTLSTQKSQDFIYNFITEELNEYLDACINNDLIGIADALGDIIYVLCNGILVHGLGDRFENIYNEIQNSNMSKLCETEEIAQQTIKFHEPKQGECYYGKVKDHWVVYRKSDKKVMKSINHKSPNLKQFFTKQELQNV